MDEELENVRQELKRVEHLFWVSLKYTRTVDVIRNTLQRLINLFDFGFDCILQKAKDEKKIDNYPKIPALKCDLLKKINPEETELCDYLDLYLKMRKILLAKYTKREEYRRHVTMTVEVDGEKIDVNIDLLREYYEKGKQFYNYLRIKIKGESEI